MKRMYLIIVLLLFSQLAIAQKTRALLVGISDYHCVNKYGGWNNIHGKNDIALLYSTLTNNGVSVSCLYDREATKIGITTAINKLISQCETGDIVYLHFSTHGQPFEDINGDEDDGWDESIVPVDAPIEYIEDKYEGENHLIDDELYDFCTKIRKAIGTSGMLYVVIDACHAGSSYRGDDKDDICKRGTRNGFSKTGKLYRPKINTSSNIKIQKGAELSDICVLEACRSYQVNREIIENGIYYGPLSFYVNEQLEKITLSSDISWIEQVKSNMDRRLVGQNMVVESSK